MNTSIITLPKRGRPCLPVAEGANIVAIEAKRRQNLARYYARDDVEGWARTAMGNARKRARRWDVGFDMTLEQIMAKLTTHCPILGIELDITKGRKTSKHNSATLDRIDPDGGYTNENVHVVSDLANRGKAHMSLAQLVLLGEFAQKLLLV